MVFPNQNDAVVALQMVGPTAQDAAVTQERTTMTHLKLTFLQRCMSEQSSPRKSHPQATHLHQSKQEGSKPPPHSFKSIASNMVSPSLLMSFKQKAASFDLRLMKMNMWPP